MATKTFQRALVTGASSGIGDSFARLLAADGVELVVVARSTAKLEALAEQLPVAVEVITADLTDAADLARVAKRLDAEPAIDLLVNNAGFGSSRPFGKAELDVELAQVRIHIDAMMTLTHAALRAMHPRGGGGILNVSSMAGFQPGPGSATYAACKAFETSFTESAHLENRDRGIHISALCPGYVDTPMVHGGTELSRLSRSLLLDPDHVARDGLAGVADNKAVVVPGVAWKAAAGLTGSLPRGVTRSLMVQARRLR